MDEDEAEIPGAGQGRASPAGRVDSPTDDPFRNWPNGDLLANTDDQAFMWRHHPDVAPLLDWPELRKVFARYDSPAAASRRRSRRFGFLAMIAGFLSLVIAAVMPLLAHPCGSFKGLVPGLGVFSAVLGVSGIVMGYTQVLRGEDKGRWLANRTCAERTRQFHFQLIINNLAIAVRAVGDLRGAEAWRTFRADALDRLEREHLEQIGEKLHGLLKDHAEADVWLLPEWGEPEPFPSPSDRLDRLLAVLGEQRFGIQKRYSALKLRKGWHSPVSRSDYAARSSDDLTLFLLLATILAGGCAAAGLVNYDTGALRDWALALGGVFSAGVIALRVLDQGLQLTAEAERYQWYNAAVEALETRFARADWRGKINLLREMEHLAYQEMRRFVVSFDRSRFVG